MGLGEEDGGVDGTFENRREIVNERSDVNGEASGPPCSISGGASCHRHTSHTSFSFLVCTENRNFRVRFGDGTGSV